MGDEGTIAGSGPDRPLHWPVFATASLGLLASLANLLNFHHYPVFRAEIGLTALLLLSGALFLAGLHRLSQPRLSFVITGFVAAIILDLNSDLNNLVFPAAWIAFGLLAYRYEKAVLQLSASVFASILLFQAAQLAFTSAKPASMPNEAEVAQSARAPNRQLRPIVHLVLDSYIGLEGMTAPGTGFGNLRQEQEQFYLSHGFQLYPGAYSRHAKTINALSEFLSYGRAKRAQEPRNVQLVVPKRLDYFTDLDRLGYRTSVLAPSVVDMCPNQPLSNCQNYNRSDLSALLSSPLSVLDRTRIIAATMVELSQFTAILGRTIDPAMNPFLGNARRHFYNRAKLYSLTGLEKSRQVVRDLSGLQFGEARFIHLLIPHDPYILDSACRVTPEPQWGDEHGPSDFAQRDQAYARQASCVTRNQIGAILNALAQTEAGRNAIVIIQGDHGSRTVDYEPVAGGVAPGTRELAMCYSAFFAIRVPGEPAAKVEGQYALAELIGGLAAQNFSRAPRPQSRPPRVFLMDDNWIPVEAIPFPKLAREFPKN